MNHPTKIFGVLAKTTTVALLAATSHISAKADNLAYAMAYNADFGTLDLTTGGFTKLDNLGISLAGFGLANGNVYAATYNASSTGLYEVNTANGTLTHIGGDNINITAFGSTTSGGLYALGGANSYTLYSINPLTGIATIIGNTGLSGANATTWGGLSDGGSQLYFSDNNRIFKINTATGAPTSVGSTGSDDMSALIFENNTLYGSQATPAFDVDVLNQLSGSVISSATVTGIPGGFSGFSGLAPVPEPASLALAAVGGMSLALLRKRKKA